VWFFIVGCHYIKLSCTYSTSLRRLLEYRFAVRLDYNITSLNIDISVRIFKTYPYIDIVF
jgi:hypothetical protein